jgi:DNA primase
MGLSIEDIKSLDLAELLSVYYGMHFKRVGNEYVTTSPFNEEMEPSFFVRKLNGHWLFKDFSSGHGGSIIDFVQIKENLNEAKDAIIHINSLINGKVSVKKARHNVPLTDKCYDIQEVYAEIKKNDIDASRQYLQKRGISDDLTKELIDKGILLHNRVPETTYCCFAVRGPGGELQCLDNHEIGGHRKFVLGKKHIFTLEFQTLKVSHRVFITEGIIDYLSIKMLEGDNLPGIALLGNIPIFEPELLSNAGTLLCALDDDKGGTGGVLEIKEKFPDKQIQLYDLEGHKDPNELLITVRAKKRTNLTVERKLSLYKEFLVSSNKTELANKWGIDRSYMYDIVNACEEFLLKGIQEQRPGRKSLSKPQTLKQAWETIAELEQKNYKEAVEKEKYMARSEFLSLRLKWAEHEVSEVRGEKEVKDNKRQIKKKRKRRR